MHEVERAIEKPIEDLLREMIKREASDLHLVPGHPPVFRVHGRLAPSERDVLDGEFTRRLAHGMLLEDALKRFDDHKNVDTSLAVRLDGALARFRVNVFYAGGAVCACLRHIPNDPPTFDWMGFPEGLARRIMHLTNGLVIVTGITGSGKTTTLAALVEMLNREGGYRVITIEEPVEYLFRRQSTTVVTQREVGTDVHSFLDGLKYGLRQDPDVVLLGEIRDRETAQMALSAAETGHLILTTMHTKDAKGAVTRFIDLFPHQAQDDVRVQLSLSLRYVISQHLLAPATAGDKRVLALETLVVNHAVRVAVRFGKIESIESAIQTGRKDGMASLDDSLEQLVSIRRITPDTARRFAKDPDVFR